MLTLNGGDAKSEYTEESYYEGPGRTKHDVNKDGDVNDDSSNMSKFDGGFATALTDDEYFMVMESIGIMPDLDSVLSVTDAKRKIEGWF